MQRKMKFICIALCVIALTMEQLCVAGQKVKIAGMNGDSRIAFAV